MIHWILTTSLLVQTPDSLRAFELLARYAEERRRPAVEAVVELARDRAVIIIGDVHPAAAPKHLLVDLIDALYAEGLINALALEVPITQQSVIRTFLDSDFDDPEFLIQHPLVLRAHWGVSQEFLDIYRTVWRLNRESAGNGRIDILAIDAPRGPPAVASRREALQRFVNRDEIMEMRVRGWRESHPQGRILVFVGDLHTLKGVEAVVELGPESARLVPLAARLERLWPGEVATAFSDAGVVGHPKGATRFFSVLTGIVADSLVPFVLPTGGAFESFPDPIDLSVEGEPSGLYLLPRSYTLSRVSDLYVYFGFSSDLTPVQGQE